ncbi:Sister chromatid cohesion protein [Wickerhamomyces ciferrii]|uniref:Sister chromatid cohesion protein n=1 Tax=Wickerhamomyces ciferrii (strain ATCC 14091 / BCRC 22168 / CBS 111 / JCM 3599 / NBRC 0793 / NRRL Y-1031 F-60-10) TaxID=1206466 RepID=K0KVU0_WICCF|nr:Sister chromatid cohesion protein [Wickerhamomyces ciferrii]CCH45614.1 Sister chromatid cohesion protein [Wickerhamomyces ciferrii]
MDPFPTNLKEGLVAPLLAPINGELDQKDSVLDPVDQELYDGFKPVLEDTTGEYDEIRSKLLRKLNLNQSVSESSTFFKGFDKDGDDDSTMDSKSLFEGLSGFSKDIVNSVELISDDRIIHGEVDEQKIIKKEKPSKPLNNKRHSSVIINDVDLKKRKSDVGIQHLQLENISIQKLKSLILDKIGLVDDSIDYNNSQIWLEVPNYGFVLSDNTIVEIEEHLSKISGTKLTDEIPFEILDRIKKLSINNLSSIENIEWTNIDLESEFWSLKFALNSLKAVSLILIIFNFQRREKKLYLDEDLMSALNFVYKIMEDLILPVTITNSNLSSETSKLIIGIINLLKKNYELFGIYISQSQANDNIITKLEYLSIIPFFHIVERKSLVSNFQILRISSMDLLIKIFKFKSDQRKYLINEILSNFDKLPTNKNLARSIKLSRGANIQPFTALILNFLNSINIKDIELNKIFKENEVSNSNLEALHETITELDQERSTYFSMISSNLINKLITQLSPNFKITFEMFITDLLNLVKFPEWSIVEPILASITNTLISNSENQTSIVETYILEVIGIIGSTMLELKGIDELPDSSIIQLEFDYSQSYSYSYTLSNQTFFQYASDSIVFDWILKLFIEYDQRQNDDNLDKKNKAIFQESFNGILTGYYRDRSNNYIRKSNGSENQELATSSYKKVLLNGKFMKLYQNFLGHLLKAIDHPKIKSRTRAMKNLAQLIDKDSRLLNIPMVKSSLSNRIQDPSPLVRLAVLEIFDQYILKKPELIGEFYQTLILTNDKSISVRTKSLKIAKRIFQESNDIKIKLFTIEKILKRLEDDEENILDFTKQILMDSIFISTYSQTIDENNEKNPQGIKAQIENLVNTLLLLINSNEKNWELFESYLNSDIIRITDENKKIHKNLISTLNIIVEYLLNFIIDYMDTEKQKSVEQGLALLSIFAKCDYDLINQDQLMSLQPYLTTDSNISNTTSSYYTLVIFRYSINPKITYKDQFLTDSQTSLLRRLTKFTARELEEAMPLVWSLSVAKKDTLKIANAALSCLSLIKPHIDIAMKDGLINSDPKVLRLIYLIGSFGKYCELESNRSIFIEKMTKLGLKDKESILSLITKFLLVFTRKSVNRQTRRVAIRNLIGVCSTHPKLFMSPPILKILDLEFSNGDVDFKQVMIQGISDFLEREEKQSFKRSGNDGKISSKLSIDVDVFHGNSKMFENDGICTSLVQRYMEPILDMCLYDDGEHSFLAVKYLRLIVKLEFANPRICIPTVIALEASKLSYVRSIALEIHRVLHSKHESLIDSSYIHGIKLAVQYRSKLTSNLLEENPFFFEKFYKIIQDSRSSKKKLFNQLIKSFNFDLENIKNSDLIFLKNYVLFLSNSIPHAQLINLDEVFQLVDGVDNVISNNGVNLKSIVSEHLSKPEIEDELLERLSLMSLIILSLIELKSCLIKTYKIPEFGQRNELKQQKAKHNETSIELFDVSKESGSFIQVLNRLNDITF